MNKLRYIYCLLFVCLLASCDPDATWETEDVTINISVQSVSAGFIECDFSTNKEAYYLIACQEVDENFNPMTRQKQFMTLALDSANAEYLLWRNSLLREGEFNIASFASHTLQYGSINHFFTNLLPNKKYWVYAFVVNPETLKPAGKLFLQTIQTTEKSTIPISFEYRVKGYWDYLYPVDAEGNIYTRFPYIATTRDSAFFAEMEIVPEDYFDTWLQVTMDFNLNDHIFYGVRAVENTYYTSSYLTFEYDHTYYTAIAAFDGGLGKKVIYKFHWLGEDTEYYFTEQDAYFVGE